MVIHLIAPKDKSKWPEIWHICYNKWESSPYKIKMWYDEDVDNLLREDDKEFFDILNTLAPIYKFDYVRYVILDHFGGAYFDMDVEIVNDFIKYLNPDKIYFMEGTGGTLVENSIMISSFHPFPIWNRFKMFSKRKILENLDKCQSFYNVLHYVGPWMMTEMLIKKYKKDKEYSILGFEQFGNPHSEISFSKHHQTNVWVPK